MKEMDMLFETLWTEINISAVGISTLKYVVRKSVFVVTYATGASWLI